MWRLPPALRWYVLGVITAAAAAVAATAALTSWRLRDVLLFGLLMGLGAVAVEFTRRVTVPAGLIKEIHGTWQLPMALLLPPVYCLLAPVITIGLLQLRTRRTIAHRRVFTAAANGLSLGAASVMFHALPATGTRPLLWLLTVTACALLWSATNKILVMTAVWASDRTVSVREQLFTREPLLNDACEIATALVLAGAITRIGLILVVPAVPLVIVQLRAFRHAQLLGEARVDAKTGLLHAGAWRAEAEVQLARAQDTRVSLVLGIIDLDRFAAINDAHGWRAGDAVLAALADKLRASLRPSDLVGRLGGEEFIFLLPGVTASEARRVAERVRGGLASQAVPAGPPGQPVRVTMSIGLAAADDPTGRDLTDLLTAADAALYQAKRAGGDRITLASGSTSELELDKAESAGEDAGSGREEREQLVAARREMGRMLAAWRKRAGMTQKELASQAGYSRGTVASAEAGDPLSGTFWAAVDQAVGARGALVARSARIEAAVTAIRQRATRQAWLARREATGPGLPATVPDAGTMAAAASACPHCGKPFALVTTTVIAPLPGTHPAEQHPGS